MNSKLAYDSIPHLCHIEMTYKCNQNCIFCYNPNRNSRIDFKTVDKIVEAVAKNRIPHVYLIGGEPSVLADSKINEYIAKLSPYSSITIVTNGLRTMRGISNKLACFGVPIHGQNARMHEFLNDTPGSFEKTLQTIRHYVNNGHDVRCIPVLTGYNFDQMYNIIKIAASLGMESVYVDRYEDGGVGAGNSSKYDLRVTKEQFSIALGQMIQAREDFSIFERRIGFGTAIPYCLDGRLISENITSNCGVGTSFCAINPQGGLRICNQSEVVYGNVLEESIQDIWNKTEMNGFRDLSWVEEPCKGCDFLLECTGGCKVDVNCSSKFCIDYAVRGCKNIKTPIKSVVEKNNHIVDSSSSPYPALKFRIFRVSPYTKLNTEHLEDFLVTRYQTVKLNELALEMIKAIIDEDIINERILVEKFSSKVGENEIRKFVDNLLKTSAIKLLGKEDNHD